MGGEGEGRENYERHGGRERGTGVKKNDVHYELNE